MSCGGGMRSVVGGANRDGRMMSEEQEMVRYI